MRQLVLVCGPLPASVYTFFSLCRDDIAGCRRRLAVRLGTRPGMLSCFVCFEPTRRRGAVTSLAQCIIYLTDELMNDLRLGCHSERFG